MKKTQLQRRNPARFATQCRRWHRTRVQTRIGIPWIAFGTPLYIITWLIV